MDRIVAARTRVGVRRILGRVVLAVLTLPVLAPSIGLRAVTPALAQVGSRVNGVVTGPDEAPVEGASVRLWRPDAPEAGPPPTLTDPRGEWSILGLEPGRWEIEISAEGFLDSTGWVQIRRPATPPVKVELRSLDEVSPAFSEGGDATLRLWIERGNSLLEQGRTTQARAEYEKALRALPPAQRPELLSGIARTYFLERKYEEARRSLADGLRIAPTDPVLRRLYTILMTELDRADEIERDLESFAAENGEASPKAEREVGRGSARGAELPVVDWTDDADRAGSPQTGLPPTGHPRMGHFRARLADIGPLARSEVFLERYTMDRGHLEASDPTLGLLDPGRESVHVYVPPPSGAPNGGGDGTPDEKRELAYGLLVYVSPTPFGGFNGDEIAHLLDRHGLIWVGADNSGNTRVPWDRVNLALAAAHEVSRRYPVDPERVYVAGYSGGGRVASGLAILYPEVFHGGLFLFGADWFAPREVPYEPGSVWEARFPRPAKRQLESLRHGSSLVFVTGSRDFNRAETKVTARQAQADGFRHVTYLEIPDADHYHGLDPTTLSLALDALDPQPE